MHRRTYLNVVFAMLLLLGLYLTSLHSYLLFHSLAEIFSIAVAFCIFMLAWSARRFLVDTYFLFIGIAFLFIGGLDLIHTLSYSGMGVFLESNANLPTQLWIGARYVEGLSFMVAPFFINRKWKTGFVFLSYGLVTFLLLASIFYWQIFPACFIEGMGLTPFKKVSEYIICLLLLGAMAVMYKKRNEIRPRRFATSCGIHRPDRGIGTGLYLLRPRLRSFQPDRSLFQNRIFLFDL